ncbi:fructose-bisphosphatase class II [Streptomyces bauhiniae]|uniref:fructose-bisphosphatase class II n=1 Tax=Streptomyces bauhiniae TaxID=2340725 RepID=UPI003664F08A
MDERMHGMIPALDDRVTEVTVRWLDVPVAHGVAETGAAGAVNTDETDAHLVAAMSAAALGASLAPAAFTDAMSLNDRKVAVDGAATEAAERILSQAPFRIRVAAGEGERDDSPGAHSGQWLGAGNASSTTLDGVFDYVDGTELAATAEPGALALGGFGTGVRAVPDLQAFAVLLPDGLMDSVDIMSRPEDFVTGLLDRIAEASGKDTGDLTVATHSVASNPMHRTLIDLMRKRVGEVLVPERVTVEPPSLLSLIGLSKPRIDSLIGAIGLSELAFAAGLLDLMAPRHGFVFRPASIAGPRAEPRLTSLDSLFEFSEDEEVSLRSDGWDKNRQYTSEDLVRPGTSTAAALFAVTDNPALGLRGPTSDEEGLTHVEGLLIKPAARVARIRLGYGI